MDSSSLLNAAQAALNQPAKPEQLEAFVSQFASQRLFVPSRDADDSDDKFAIALMQLEDGTILMHAATDLAMAKELFKLEADNLQEMTGSAVLMLAQQRRFDCLVHVGTGEEDNFFIDYDRLVLLAQIHMLQVNPVQSSHHDSAAARAAYPSEFAKWLYDYCLENRDIKSAHLAMVGIGSDPVPDVMVVLEAGAPFSHMERIAEHARDALRPGQLLLGKDSIASVDKEQQLMDTIRSNPPLFSRNHQQNWWGRFKRWLKPPTIVFVNIDLVGT